MHSGACERPADRILTMKASFVVGAPKTFSASVLAVVVLLRLAQLGIAGAVGRRGGRAGLPGRAGQHWVLAGLQSPCCMFSCMPLNQPSPSEPRQCQHTCSIACACSIRAAAAYIQNNGMHAQHGICPGQGTRYYKVPRGSAHSVGGAAAGALRQQRAGAHAEAVLRRRRRADGRAVGVQMHHDVDAAPAARHW